MKNEKLVYNWKAVEVYLNGKTIEETIPLVHTKNETEMEFYLKRNNKYYFRNSLNFKFALESKEDLPFKKGDKFNVNI